MKERGVFGGSMLGITFLHASVNASLLAGAAGTSLENARAPAAARPRRAVLARRSIVGGRGRVGSLGSRKVGENHGEEGLVLVFATTKSLTLRFVICENGASILVRLSF